MPIDTDMATNSPEDLLQRCLEAGELSPSRVHHTSMCNAHTHKKCSQKHFSSDSQSQAMLSRGLVFVGSGCSNEFGMCLVINLCDGSDDENSMT